MWRERASDVFASMGMGLLLQQILIRSAVLEPE
jgi:hypothetical protein